jgi:hypothetical protein
MQTIANSSNDHHNQEVTVMQCQDVWDLLSAYADGETNPQETALVEAHVATCQNCARDLQFMQGTQEALQALPTVEPPISLRSAILAATVNRPSFTERFATAVRRGLAPAPVRYGALAAAGAAAALTAVTIRDQGNPVHYAPKQPAAVATVPHVLDNPAQPGRTDGLSVDLLDVYEPATTASASQTPRTRTARSRGNDARPVIRFAQNAPAATTRRTARIAAAAPVDPRSKQPSQPDDLTPAASSASPTTQTTNPDPEPEVRTMVAHSETPSGSEGATPSENGVRSARIVLTASTVSLDPAQVATLADLRRSLGQQAGAGNGVNHAVSRRDRQIRVDVIRGSF